ncbi:hypothetical protein K493DRAFT_271276 [Basidiobolus meristosporus CBS 931.73]|uniref:YCII-related domain-containing protein n=1 Tax=Basidiobolus meristosporus CBS 931.73 TaxID=1314790 RepID=A0A1Y1WZX8_9FUNG|nr:hypothetical protein K493DRAFT_271276 [Basidiobolus meristosporus CBS 931.73]|eukprot:ORX78654.1 hypothetical protein K493DRAFT_271276 [Basidiobolus meristosporus CBS 931.73]
MSITLKAAATHLGKLPVARSFSTSVTAAGQFLVISKDFTDQEALSRRMAVREKHLESAQKLYNEERLLAGGAIFSEEGASGKMIGSCIVLEAENAEEVKKVVAADPYIQGKVWDKIEIYPLKLAFPFKK